MSLATISGTHMTDTPLTALNALSELAGVETSAAENVRRHLLTALDYPAMTDSQTEESLRRAGDLPFKRVLPPVRVLRLNRNEEIIAAFPRGQGYNCSWLLTDENGKEYSGTINLEEADWVAEREIGGVFYEQRRFRCPHLPEPGYHSFRLELPTGDAGQTSLIVAPERCYFPVSLERGERTWGIPVQFYALRSETNQGIGDFTDLASLGHTLAENGAGVLGISPIHAMFVDKPHEASPYSPASRTFFNHLYIDVTKVPDFPFCEEAMDLFNSENFQTKLKNVRDYDYVDYTSVSELKTAVLHPLYRTFKETELGDDPEGYLTERGQDFREFCKRNDGGLHRFATYQALSVHFAGEAGWWKEWPEEFHSPYNGAVRRYVEENREKIEFYKYLQWETTRQLGDASKACTDGGMAVGLYMDLAVGVSHGSAEVWAEPDLYAAGVAAGTPPDVLRDNGVDWGLAAMKPKIMFERAYAPFIAMVHRNMHHARCLRLDHVLQLQRLFLITHALKGCKGAFVQYPVDDLMGIVALESHRNMCMVIGEDLGMLPEGFREKMADHRILSYRVLPFERDYDGGRPGRYKDPSEYPHLSATASSTHDTPPLASQWTMHHGHEKEFMGLYSSDTQRNEAFRNGAENRHHLNEALTRSKSWDFVDGKSAEDPYNTASFCPEYLERAVAQYLAWAPSAVMLMPLSDIFLVDRLGNIPGTMEEHKTLDEDERKKQEELEDPADKRRPNWRIKEPYPIEVMDKLPRFKAVAEILNKERPSGKNQQRVKQRQKQTPAVPSLNS